MDGYTATRRLRDSGVTVPVFAFTAHALRGFEKEIVEAGCDGYITKPIDIDLLLRTLAERLGGTRVGTPQDGATDAGAMLTAAPAAAAGTAAGAAAPLVSRLAGHARLTPVVARFAQGLPGRIAELRAAFDAGDAAGFADIAHWLKGSAGSVGYDVFTAPARDAERAAREGNLAAAAGPLAQIESLGARVAAPEAALATA